MAVPASPAKSRPLCIAPQRMPKQELSGAPFIGVTHFLAGARLAAALGFGGVFGVAGVCAACLAAAARAARLARCTNSARLAASESVTEAAEAAEAAAVPLGSDGLSVIAAAPARTPAVITPSAAMATGRRPRSFSGTTRAAPATARSLIAATRSRRSHSAARRSRRSRRVLGNLLVCMGGFLVVLGETDRSNTGAPDKPGQIAREGVVGQFISTVRRVK